MPTISKKINVTYRLPAELIRAVRMEAAHSGRWPAEVVTVALRSHLKELDRIRGRSRRNGHGNSNGEDEGASIA